jgi:hypothetical protein
MRKALAIAAILQSAIIMQKALAQVEVSVLGFGAVDEKAM